MRRPAVFLLGLLWCVVCVADYDAGNAAYKEGDKATALAQWQPLAEAGDAPAQYGLGLIYEYGGGGVDRNYPRAAIWYRLAAEQGKTNAQAALGYLYRNGLGVEQDDAEAFAWYQRSAEAGNRRGQYRLAFMYRYGHGVERDYSRALEWLHKSAAQQYPYAYVRLGDMYRRGLGVASDLGEAVRWYKRAAERDIGSVQFELARLYSRGAGVPQDRAMAQALFDQAAEHGDELESVYARVYPYVGGRGVALMLAGMLLAMAGSLYRGSLPVVIMRRDRPGHLGRLSHWLIRLTSFVAILVGMLVYLELDAPDLGGDRHWFYLNALVGFAALVVSMVLHELGHAPVARLVGFKVFLVIIGIGPRLFEGHAGATRVIVNAFPTFGLTTVATRRPERFRSRYSLVVLAGPATNLGLAALCYVWLGGDVSLASFFQGLAPVTAALFANLLLFVTNVIPFGSFATDGYQLVRIPGLTPAERLEHEASYFAHEGFEILLAGDIEGAESRFRAGLERYPESLILNLNLGGGLGERWRSWRSPRNLRRA